MIVQFNRHDSANPTATERLIRLPEVERQTGIRKSKLYASVKANEFPAPIRLSPKLVVWRESQVQQWIADQIAAHAGTTQEKRGHQ